MQGGEIGKLGAVSFPDAVTIMEHLERTGDDATITIGLRFREPRTRTLKNKDAIGWLNINADSYTYEAYYDGGETLHIDAI